MCIFFLFWWFCDDKNQNQLITIFKYSSLPRKWTEKVKWLNKSISCETIYSKTCQPHINNRTKCFPIVKPGFPKTKQTNKIFLNYQTRWLRTFQKPTMALLRLTFFTFSSPVWSRRWAKLRNGDKSLGLSLELLDLSGHAMNHG